MAAASPCSATHVCILFSDPQARGPSFGFHGYLTLLTESHSRSHVKPTTYSARLPGRSWFTLPIPYPATLPLVGVSGHEHTPSLPTRLLLSIYNSYNQANSQFVYRLSPLLECKLPRAELYLCGFLRH